MFSINVNQELYNYCVEQTDNFNFGARYTANGTKEQQLTGIIGQSIVMNLFDLKWLDGNDGFDNGVDIVFDNKKIDVKTMGRTTDVRENFTNNFLKLQDYFETDIYIFCSYNKTKKNLTICGWIDKKEFESKRKYYPKGTLRYRSDGSTFESFSDLYEIDIVDLYDVICIDDLKKQILNNNNNTNKLKKKEMGSITGTIKKVYPIKQVTEKFKVREFILTIPDEKYPQNIIMQLNQTKCDLVNESNAGDEIMVNYNLKGKEYTNRDGETKFFNSIEAWRIDFINKDNDTQQKPSTPQINRQNEIEDSPF